MRWTEVAASLLLSATTVTAGRSPRHVGIQDRELPVRGAASDPSLHQSFKRASPPQFLNANTSKFAVDGSAIPDVDFDIGESYAGQLSLSSDPDDEDRFYFWFVPSTNPDAKNEILIWLNGGPGCSSLEGFLQENGPFLWQYGTYKPIENPWAWNKLTNVVWVEQPIGTGFSEGEITATSEDDVAEQFMGFWKNFIDTFSMQGYTVYISGESYAGMYCPYIASHFLDANDTTYYNMSGMLIYDPSISFPEVQEPITTVQFTDYWNGLHPFNDSFQANLHERAQACGYIDYVDKYLVYPPAGQAPSKLPGTDDDGVTTDECWNIYWDVWEAALAINPCWDVYQVATTCPILWDVLGFPGTFGYLPDGATIYFDRADVKAAINAPNITWEECTDKDVFINNTDNSLPPAITVLPGVIDRTQNVIIAHGALDMILIANGTLLAIQNMTWGGKLGFQSKPVEPFYVPYHNDTSLSTVAGAGVFGTTHEERGLTWVAVDLAGHMVPQYAPSAAFRHLEKLLGRVDSLSSTAPFTTDPGYPQSTGPLGQGTAPQGWSNAGGSNCTKKKRSVPRRK